MWFFSEYYFSIDNLIKDHFLRRQMDSNGFLPLSVLARFPKVKSIVQDIAYLLDILLQSSEIEVYRESDNIEDTLIRKRYGWDQWVYPEGERDPAARARSIPSTTTTTTAS